VNQISGVKPALRSRLQVVPNDTVSQNDTLTAPTIFHEAWWLDLVTNGQIESVESLEHGKIVGRMYFVRDNRYGISSSNMPAFTHFLGPVVNPGAGAQQTRYLKELSITSDLIDKLPKFSSFRQKMHRGITDVVEFQAAGFESSVQFTFEIAPGEEKAIWGAMRDKTRNAIRNGEKMYNLSSAIDPDAFIDFYQANLRSQGESENIDLSVARRLTRRCVELGCGKFFVASDRHGNAKAAIFVVWDQSACYYLLSTRSPDSTYGATAAAIWAALRFAAANGLVFDFDGVASAGAVKFFAGFGGSVVPRYIVSRASLAYRLLREARRRFTNASNAFC
jgi:hypothetical protein